MQCNADTCFACVCGIIFLVALYRTRSSTMPDHAPPLLIPIRDGQNLLLTNSLGLLVLIIAILGLHLLNLGHVLLLSLLGRDALVDELLPRAVLGFALFGGDNISICPQGSAEGGGGEKAGR